MPRAIGQFTISDMNDVNIQTMEPSLKVINMLWLDTSSTPNVLKRWNESEWEIISDPDKISNEDLNKLADIVGNIAGDILGKADAGELETLTDAYNARVAQDVLDKAKVASDLATLDGRVAVVNLILEEKAAKWTFIETSVTMAEEGIFIGNAAKQMGVLVAEDRISFIDKGTEVAYISNKTMEITHGIFVESAIIGKHKIETITGTDITVFVYVG